MVNYLSLIVVWEWHGRKVQMMGISLLDFSRPSRSSKGMGKFRPHYGPSALVSYLPGAWLTQQLKELLQSDPYLLSLVVSKLFLEFFSVDRPKLFKRLF